MKKIFNFTGKSKIFMGISIAIILIGIVCNVIFGVTLDIQFTGGTILQYSYTGEVDTDAMKYPTRYNSPKTATATAST